ncbi:MAG TPA: hypothetical protein QGG59_09060, partial [Planctomycetota bacterium]|nr:hypothetical protein [Planctomycetota bacterium]
MPESLQSCQELLVVGGGLFCKLASKGRHPLIQVLAFFNLAIQQTEGITVEALLTIGTTASQGVAKEILQLSLPAHTVIGVPHGVDPNLQFGSKTQV